jgi:4-aminobutyrate aminotransferase-like enzyme
MTILTARMIARRETLLGSAYRLFYEDPVHIVRGEGVWLYGADGQKYLDMYNNVPHVGHCHPQVVTAISEQVSTLNTHTRYLHEKVLAFAEQLTAKFSVGLDTAMFCCTGSEANELALRIASTVSGHKGLIVTDYAYHGNTTATYEISTSDTAADEMPSYVVTVPAPDTYRGRYRDHDAADRYAAHVVDAIELLKQRGFKPAAFVVDTILSSSGIISPPPGYLCKVAEIIRSAGGLFVADEVQPGFGRTGKNFWGFEADDLVPDIVTMGKPMGNGHPLAGIVTRRDLVESFSKKAHYFKPFGGNPVSCAAGLAVLDIIDRENLQRNALDVGQFIIDGLLHLAESHDCIGDVRGSGLFLAVELVTDQEARTPATELARQVVENLRERGVLTGTIGCDSNILKLRPPMTLSRNDAEYFLSALKDSL